MGNTGKKNVCLGLAVHAAVRGGTCAFTLKIVSTLIKTAHATIGLRSRHRINPPSTRLVSGKGNECKWRPRRYQVDTWSRRRDVARSVLRSSPKPEKRSVFSRRRGIEIFLRVLSTRPWTNVLVSDAWPARGWVGSPNGRAPLCFFYTLVDKCVCIRRLAGAHHVSPAVL